MDNAEDTCLEEPVSHTNRCKCCAYLWELLDTCIAERTHLRGFVGPCGIHASGMEYSDYEHALTCKIRELKMDIMLQHCGMFSPDEEHDYSV